MTPGALLVLTFVAVFGVLETAGHLIHRLWGPSTFWHVFSLVTAALLAVGVALS